MTTTHKFPPQLHEVEENLDREPPLADRQSQENIDPEPARHGQSSESRFPRPEGRQCDSKPGIACLRYCQVGSNKQITNSQMNELEKNDYHNHKYHLLDNICLSIIYINTRPYLEKAGASYDSGSMLLFSLKNRLYRIVI